MEIDRKFLLLCAAEVLVVAVDNLILALILFAAVVASAGNVALIGLAAALGCGYLILTLYDYRLTRWAGGEA